MIAVSRMTSPPAMINSVGLATNLLAQAGQGTSPAPQRLWQAFQGVFDQVKNLFGTGLPGIQANIYVHPQPSPFSPRGVRPGVVDNPLGPLENSFRECRGESGLFTAVSALNQHMLDGLSKLDAMEEEAMKVCMSDKPSDQAQGQYLLSRFKQMEASISFALRAQSAVSRTAARRMRLRY